MVHPKGMEVAPNVIETWQGSRAETTEVQLCIHRYLDEEFEGFGETQDEKCYKSRITAENPRQEDSETQS